jgi:hypothetical protein
MKIFFSLGCHVEKLCHFIFPNRSTVRPNQIILPAYRTGAPLPLADAVRVEAVERLQTPPAPSRIAILIITTPTLPICLAPLLHTSLQRRHSTPALQQSALALTHTTMVDDFGAQIEQRIVDLQTFTALMVSNTVKGITFQPYLMHIPVDYIPLCVGHHDLNHVKDPALEFTVVPILTVL